MDSDLKMFSHPMIRGERGRERAAIERRLKMFPGFRFYECRGERGEETRHHREGLTGGTAYYPAEKKGKKVV